MVQEGPGRSSPRDFWSKTSFSVVGNYHPRDVPVGVRPPCLSTGSPQGTGYLVHHVDVVPLVSGRAGGWRVSPPTPYGVR